MCENYYIWNPATCICINGKYLASIITCDEVIEETKTFITNFNEKKRQSVKTKFLYFTCFFINYHCITDSIYCYLIKYRATQTHLLPYYITNHKFKKFYINSIS